MYQELHVSILLCISKNEFENFTTEGTNIQNNTFFFFVNCLVLIYEKLGLGAIAEVLYL